MVELTELPLEWCIKITEENKDVLTKWKQTIKPESDEAGHYESNYVNNEGLNRINSHEYIVISFEQFKKWVLKENIQYKYEVVNCETQEQWDFVNSKLESEFKLSSSTWKGYADKSCKCFNNIEYCYLDFYKNQNSLILTFQEWCDKFGHVNPLNEKIEPWSARTYVVITGEYHSVKIGEIHKINDVIDGLELSVNISESVGAACLPPKSSVKWFATLKEAEEFSKTLTKTEVSMNNSDLLEKAKREYPIGTKVMYNNYNNREYEVKKELQWQGCGISHYGLPFIYHKDTDKWAEIVSTPEIKNITNGLTNPRINHNFNEPIKTNNVLLLDTITQLIIKEERLSSIIKLVKPKQILKIK